VQSRGIHHLDLVVTNVERSKAFYSSLLRGLGWAGALELEAERGEVESAPKDFPHYVDGYYAAFFYDPDGIKLEVVHEPTRAETTTP
jgi:catechol 2,3-dioxygenase-like lactoylglutathione lyase family enzyme